MGMKLIENSINQAEKGTVIYDINQQLTSICLVVKGRILVVNNGAKIILGSGSFIGISELNVGHYINTYIAMDDVTFYCFPVRDIEGLTKIFSINKDYRGLMAVSMVKYLYELNRIYQIMMSTSERLYKFIRSNYSYYLDNSYKLGYASKPISDIEELFSYESEITIDENKLSFYLESSKISLDTWKAFCSNGDVIVLYFIDEISEMIFKLTSECGELTSYIKDAFENLMNDSEACLYKRVAALAITVEEAGGYNVEIVKVLDAIIDEINVVERTIEEISGIHLNVDRERMEEIYFTVLSKESNRKEQLEEGFKYTQQETNQVFSDLGNSLSQIMNYGEIDKEQQEHLEQLLLNFINLKDKHSTEDNVRILRKQLTELFYSIYEKVFFISYQEKELPKPISLFLKYGFLDERLLNKDQLKELYFLDNQEMSNSGPCMVYNIKDWLTEIYKGNKEPSKNEFDLDYRDMLRDERKRGKITEADEKELQTNLKQKVIYEIHNMFRYNHRIANGQISTFVPFLCGDSIVQNLNNLYVSNERINAVINELLKIDYSVFHREILYVNAEKGIEKEYIMKVVYPDIILMPTVGYNGVMWQEITEKRKSKEGRFILPLFTEVALKDLLIKLLGRFRWELCRTVQGTAWNNIKYKSLTSEYADYIQFYRKNKDLSEEVKEKVKNQIQKGRSNYREIFVIDYEAWIKSESEGGLRLNKVARELLATYCPFSKSIRTRLLGQPLFADAMARFDRNTLKKIRELDLRYRSLDKDNIEITEELKETLSFYRDL